MRHGDAKNRGGLETRAASGERVTNLLLILCAVLFSVSAIAVPYALWSQAQLDDARTAAAGPKEMLTRLLEGRDSDECVRPHAVTAIGFVLNPSMKTCTLWVGSDDVYAVNSLGLRGAEIPLRDHGAAETRRILIVGDSWVWGWMLPDQHRLEAQLKDLLASKLAEIGAPEEEIQRYKVYSVAMPGWNVASGHAFLESHYYLLQPDIIIWVMTQNDVVDVPGAIPPGLPAHSLNPQASEAASFAEYAYTLYPMPFLKGRWQRNFHLVRSIGQRYGVPIVGLLVHMDPAFVNYVVPQPNLGFPVLLDSPLQLDERWGVTEADAHPSLWANKTLAVTFLRHLVEVGFVPELAFTEEETSYFEERPYFGQHAAGPAQLDSYTQSYTQRTSWQYPPKNEDAKAFSESLRRFRDTGVVFINVDPEHDMLSLKLKVDPGLLRTRRSIHFSTHIQEGASAETTALISEPITDIDLPLPERRHGSLVEIRWQSDFLASAGPDSRDVGEVLSLHGATRH